MQGVRFFFILNIFFFLMHTCFAMYAWNKSGQWENTPPVPSKLNGAFITLGDDQLAYRFFSIILQNIGDVGGHTTPLNHYDFDRLAEWFTLLDHYDPVSNFIPALAAHYFGGTQDPTQLDGIIDYLSLVGQRTYGEKWRWLAQGAYLARYRQEDLDKAMGLALMLINVHKDLPSWALNMPALIASQKGDKEVAYEITMGLLKDKINDLHPNEVNLMVEIICERLLDEIQASQHDLCNHQE